MPSIIARSIGSFASVSLRTSSAFGRATSNWVLAWLVKTEETAEEDATWRTVSILKPVTAYPVPAFNSSRGEQVVKPFGLNFRGLLIHNLWPITYRQRLDEEAFPRRAEHYLDD